jgi:hypothetical protein
MILSKEIEGTILSCIQERPNRRNPKMFVQIEFVMRTFGLTTLDEVRRLLILIGANAGAGYILPIILFDSRKSNPIVSETPDTYYLEPLHPLRRTLTQAILKHQLSKTEFKTPNQTTLDGFIVRTYVFYFMNRKKRDAGSITFSCPSTKSRKISATSSQSMAQEDEAEMIDDLEWEGEEKLDDEFHETMAELQLFLQATNIYDAENEVVEEMQENFLDNSTESTGLIII